MPADGSGMSSGGSDARRAGSGGDSEPAHTPARTPMDAPVGDSDNAADAADAAADAADAAERARRDLARLGADPHSAPPVPPAVTARVIAALRTAPPRHAPTHSDRPARLRWSSRTILALVAGVGATVIGAGLGIHPLLDAAPSTDSAAAGPASSAREATAGRITVTPPPRAVPMTDERILALLARPPVYGSAGGWLADPVRRSECLRGLGHSGATEILGAAPITLAGRDEVVVVLPGVTPQTVVAVVPAPTCGADGPQSLAETEVVKP